MFSQTLGGYAAAEPQDSEERIRGRLVADILNKTCQSIPWTAKDDRVMLRALSYYQLTPNDITTKTTPVQQLGHNETIFIRLCKTLGAYYPHNAQFTAVVHPLIITKLRRLLHKLDRDRIIVIYQLPFGIRHKRVYWPAHTLDWSKDDWDGSLGDPVPAALAEQLLVEVRTGRCNVPAVVRAAALGHQTIPVWTDADEDYFRVAQHTNDSSKTATVMPSSFVLSPQTGIRSTQALGPSIDHHIAGQQQPRFPTDVSFITAASAYPDNFPASSVRSYVSSLAASSVYPDDSISQRPRRSAHHHHQHQQQQQKQQKQHQQESTSQLSAGQRRRRNKTRRRAQTEVASSLLR